MTTLNGYSTTHDYFGVKFKQASLEEISLHLTVDQITNGFVKRPDPKVRLEHNRLIDFRHAEGFANYLMRGAEDQTGKWAVIVPALSLFADPSVVVFEKENDAGGVEFGTVRIEKTATVAIWDGQHRILGMYIAVDRVSEAVVNLLEAAAKAGTEGDAEAFADLTAKLNRAQEVRRCLGKIVIPVSIALETNPIIRKELFADVADNAKGINATVLVRFDQRNVFNRAAAALEGKSLKGLVDTDQAIAANNSKFWTTLRDVAAASQTAWMGYGARWTPGREVELAPKEAEILANAQAFYSVLAAVFPDVRDVLNGTIKPGDLRKNGARTSLLSSSTMIKALASAFHDLRLGLSWVPKGSGLVRTNGLPVMTVAEITEAFHQLPPMTSGNTTKLDVFWHANPALNGVFAEPFVVPTARAGNIRTLGRAITEYARTH